MRLYDQELRERCLNLAADVFRSPGITGQQLTTVADHFFQYIKYGGDTEYDVEDEPTPPVNTGPGMGVIREISDISSVGKDKSAALGRAPSWFKEKADIASPISVPYPR